MINFNYDTRTRLRHWWYDYRSEVVFVIVLTGLLLISYRWSESLSEQVFETYINPAQYVSYIVVCLCGALLLLRHHEGILMRRTWAGVLIVWGVIDVALLCLRFVNLTTIGVAGSEPLISASVVIGNILGWMLYIYPTQVLRPGWMNWWRGLLQVLPLIVLGVIDMFVDYDLRPIIALYPAALFVTLCMHVRNYRRWCEDNYANMDNIDVQWIVRYLTMLLLVGISYYYIIFSHAPSRLFTQQWLMLFMLAYATEQILFRPDPWARSISHTAPQQSAVSPTAEADAEEDALSNVVFSADEASLQPEPNEVNAQRQQIEQWMETARPWRDPNFRLEDLRKVLPKNRSYLSQLINSAYGCTFYQFATRYRIAEAKRLLEADGKTKMQDISAACGFSSPTVFSRTFVRETGVTPREWRNQG